ncbi:transmembrane adaptor Erv26-domain-containing protein [Pisolithus marmoratus]|nr:transmembrane adaptor Erv26-domain-containing protein [Pisolithus marmoratus]
MPSLRYLCSYVGSIAAFLFMTLSLASGLLYISELIEEYSRLAKLIGQRATYLVIALHALLYMFDSLPLPQTLFSILCHAVYLQNFSSTWPLISLSSFSFIASCILAVTNHFTWFLYFSRMSREVRHSYSRHRGLMTEIPGFADIATFFGTCVWLVPLFLFLSLSANDNALPTSGVGSPSGSNSSSPRVNSSLFKSIFGILWRGGSIKSASGSSGLIAPPSPVSVRQPSSPLPLSPLGMRSPSLGPPPRTPTRKGTEDEGQFTMRLGPPVGRSLQSRRRVTADSYSVAPSPGLSYAANQRLNEDE